MNLINELQVSTEQDDVLTVLRKTKRLASKLNRQDIGEWLRSELEGYAKTAAVPDYRQVRGALAMNTNGNVPAGFGFVMDGIQELPGFGINPVLPVIDPISDIITWIEKLGKGNGVYFPVDRKMNTDGYLRSHVHPMFRNQVSFLLRMNESQIKGIPEQIKDRVLDWACALEQAGVNGEGMSFNDKEKQLAHSITFNFDNSRTEHKFDQTNYNVGDVNNAIQSH